MRSSRRCSMCRSRRSWRLRLRFRQCRASRIDAAKLQNLEAALNLKHDASGEPTDKGKAAAAALGGPGPGVKPRPKQDGREGFQEFQKLQTNGS